MLHLPQQKVRVAQSGVRGIWIVLSENTGESELSGLFAAPGRGVVPIGQKLATEMQDVPAPDHVNYIRRLQRVFDVDRNGVRIQEVPPARSVNVDVRKY